MAKMTAILPRSSRTKQPKGAKEGFNVMENPLQLLICIGHVGTDKASAAWLRWDLWDPRSEDTSGNSYCSSGRSSWYTMAMCKGHGYTWSHSVGLPATSNWNGCVTDRDQSYDVSDAAPSALITQFVADQDPYCPTKMLALTSTFSTVKTTIDAMAALGGTNQTIGLHWGWLSLLLQSPLNAPAEDANNQ